MPKNGDHWPQWWGVTWTIILAFASVMEFLHFRREWGQRDYRNILGPFFMAVGLGYMASEAAKNEWP